MRTVELLLIITVALIMATGGFWVANHYQGLTTVEKPETVPELTGLPVPQYHLGSINGSIFTPADFSGQVVLYNFWATWCAPCRKEMPMLQRFHEDHLLQGFTVVGIAIDDVQAVRDFTTSLGISYPVLVGADDVMQANRDFGNTSGSLPFSVLVDRRGIVRWWDWGILEEDELEQRVGTLLNSPN